MRARIGLYSPYFGSVYGGGERYLAQTAVALSERAASAGVEIVAPVPVDLDRCRELLGVDLRGVAVRATNRSALGLLRRLNRVGVLRPLRNFVLGAQASRTGADYDVFLPMVYAIPVAPSGRRNAMLCQFPTRDPGAAAGFELIVCQSEYVRHWIKQYWDRDALVVNPPIDVPAEEPDWPAKTNIVLTVGRFFSGGHSKRQDVMVEVFRALVDAGLEGWELHLAGTVHRDAHHRGYFESVLERSQGYPIHLHPDLDHAALEALYRRAAIYWHAAGYGADSEADPERLEHFGMTSAEAMARGAAVIAFGAGGQLEIVADGVDGRLWNSTDELASITRDLAADRPARERLGRAAREKSRRWSDAAFAGNITAALAPVLPGR